MIFFFIVPDDYFIYPKDIDPEFHRIFHDHIEDLFA